MDIPTGWTEDGKTIQRTFRTGNFARGVSFVVAIGQARGRGRPPPGHPAHLPQLSLVTLMTHDAGRVTEKDLRLAAQIDRVWEERDTPTA